MTYVYELTFDHQMEPAYYGLFSDFDSALAYLRDTLKADVAKPQEYNGNKQVTKYGDYSIERLEVKGRTSPTFDRAPRGGR